MPAGPQSKCPDAARLRELVAGSLPTGDEEPLRRHLDACVACQQTLESLAGTGKTLPGDVLDIGGEEPACDAAIERALHWDVAGAGPESTDETPFDDEVAIDFLEPSTDPSCIGRLDHYEIIEVIGKGGMGIVLRAFDEKLRRVVAIKVMAPQMATSGGARKRFVREARSAAAIRNEHVIDIHAVEGSGGLPYLVMEYIEGISLEERIKRSGPLKLHEVLRIGMQTAAGLAAAHAQGLVHRDIKPANILLENGVERVKITDFGLARTVDDASLTQSGVLAGTPQYMSPEQARGESVDHRSDLFSLGSVLYAMCTGHSPFRAETTVGVLKRVADDTPRSVQEVNADVPEALAAIIDGLLAKDPADRFQSAAEVAGLLGQHLAHVQQPSLAPLPVAHFSRSAGRGDGRRSHAPRWGWAVAAGVLLAALALVGQWFGAAARQFVTNGGELKFETDDPHVKVLVRQGNRQVATVDLEREQIIDLPAGDYELALDDARADLDLTTDRITLARGGTRLVEIREDPDFVGEIRRLEGHSSAVRSVAISPDGRRALSGGQDGAVVLWDLARGELLRRLGEPRAPVYGVAFSPDGGRALCGGEDHIMRLYNVESGEELWRFEGHTNRVHSVAFSPDGRYALSGSEDRTMRLCDAETGQELRRIDEDEGPRGVALSHDSRRILCAKLGVQSGIVTLWDVERGSHLRNYAGHSEHAVCVAFCGDSARAVSGSWDMTVRLWDVETGRQLHSFNHGARVEALAVSADGRTMLSAGWSEFIRCWAMESGRQRHVFRVPSSAIFGLAIFPDGRRALSAGADGTVREWRLPASEVPVGEAANAGADR